MSRAGSSAAMEGSAVDPWIDAWLRARGDALVELRAIEGLGTVNRVLHVQARAGSYVLRLNTADKEGEYLKERWCHVAARAAGIPTPRVIELGVGTLGAFMIMERVPGVNASCMPERAAFTWHRLGDFMRRLHTIPVAGFGDGLGDPAGCFTTSWAEHVGYNLGQLARDDDPLRTEGWIDDAGRDVLRGTIEWLARQELAFGLIHGDLAPRNVVLDHDHATLLDWGTAEIHASPHTELGILLYTEKIPQAAVDALLEGYGWSAAELRRAEPLRLALHLLKRLDTVRWGLDRAPSAVPELVAALQEALELAS